MTRKRYTNRTIGVVAIIAAVAAIASIWFRTHDPLDTQAMLDASVSIRTVSHVHVDQFGDSVWEAGSGSGFLVSTARCEVWSNHHVVENAAFVEVFPRGWTGSSGIAAKVVNASPRTDVAILHLERCDGIREAVLGDSDHLRPGDETYAVGNPLGRNPDSISRGIISHTNRTLTGIASYLQTDAAINPGNSGGALFDAKGRVIGISTALASLGEATNIGIGYAVPINVAGKVVAGLRDGPPRWGDAGLLGLLGTLSPDEAEVFAVPSRARAVILTADPEPGASHGKLFARDVIYQIDATPVRDANQVTRLISNHSPGETLQFHLVRAGKVAAIDVELDNGWKGNKRWDADYCDGVLGMKLEHWDGDHGLSRRFDTPVITRIYSLGPAHQAHITSSQSSVAFRGPIMVPFQPDVKTVTGVVYAGRYHQATSPSVVETFARQAFDSDAPLLLEIELWARADPRNVGAPLTRRGKAFYRVNPAETIALAELGDDTVADLSGTARLEETVNLAPEMNRRAYF